MRKLLYVLSIGVIATTLVLPATAQEKRSSKLGAYDEIVIKRKNSDKDAKVTVEIKNGEIWVDGKKLDEYKDGNIIVQRRAVIPRNGNMGGMQFFDEGEEREVPVRGNKAVLGVITEKQEAAGATVTEVAEGSAAEKAGLKKGDVITALNDEKVSEPQELFEAIGEMEPGDKVTVTYKRSGKENKASATLGEREDNAPRMFSLPPGRPDNQFRFRMPPSPGRPPFGFAPEFRGGGTRLGLSVQDTEDGKGAKVLHVINGSAAEKAGFKENDLVTEIAGKPVKNAKDVADTYRENKEQGNITAKVLRNGNAQTLTIKVPENLNTENL